MLNLVGDTQIEAQGFAIGQVNILGLDAIVRGAAEKVLLKKLKGVTKPQLSNLKSHLYKELLASLRAG